MTCAVGSAGASNPARHAPGLSASSSCSWAPELMAANPDMWAKSIAQHLAIDPPEPASSAGVFGTAVRVFYRTRAMGATKTAQLYCSPLGMGLPPPQKKKKKKTGKLTLAFRRPPLKKEQNIQKPKKQLDILATVRGSLMLEGPCVDSKASQLPVPWA